MRNHCNLLAVFVPISVIFASLSYAQPKIPQKTIPTNIAPDVRKGIELLYSSDEARRAEGAKKLGEMGNLATLAIPYLIEILEDNVGVLRVVKGTDSAGKPIPEGTFLNQASRATAEFTFTSPASIAEGALKKITGQDLGRDKSKWIAWWEKNKSK